MAIPLSHGLWIPLVASAMLLALAAGCDDDEPGPTGESSTSDTGGAGGAGGAGGQGSSPCPSLEPYEGQHCYWPDLRCTYPGSEECGETETVEGELVYHCDSGEWELESSTVPECPVPDAGL